MSDEYTITIHVDLIKLVIGLGLTGLACLVAAAVSGWRK